LGVFPFCDVSPVTWNLIHGDFQLRQMIFRNEFFCNTRGTGTGPPNLRYGPANLVYRVIRPTGGTSHNCPFFHATPLKVRHPPDIPWLLRVPRQFFRVSDTSEVLGFGSRSSFVHPPSRFRSDPKTVASLAAPLRNRQRVIFCNYSPKSFKSLKMFGCKAARVPQTSVRPRRSSLILP